MHETIAFIGAGNMGSALIGGLLAAGHPADRLRAVVRSQASAAALHARFGIAAGCSIDDETRRTDVLILAVKPQQLAEVAAALQPTAATVISVLNGARVAILARHLGPAAQIVRAMPNTPSAVGRGSTGLFADAAITAAARDTAEAVMRKVGSVCWVADEDQFDAVTALSGCGPAYFYRFVEALRRAGMSLGLAPEIASTLALDTFVGAAELARMSGDDVADLRAQVTSRGGSTEAALARFDANGFDDLIEDALATAARTSRQRGDEIAALIAGAAA